MSNDKYILDGHKAIICNDLMKWAKWFETADRQVAKAFLTNDVHISTVFLGLNLNYGDGKPMLFETMVFGGKMDEQIERYSTWQEAEDGHKRWVGQVLETEGSLVSIQKETGITGVNKNETNT